MCVNSEGSYECVCGIGFGLTPDRRSCLGAFMFHNSNIFLLKICCNLEIQLCVLKMNLFYNELREQSQ